MSEETLPELTWPKQQIQADWALLAQCLMDPASVRRQSLDEQRRFLELAGMHSLGPLMYHRLKTTVGLEGVTDQVAVGLRGMYLRTAALGLVRGAQVSSLGQAFARVDVPALFFKGVILASHVYSDSALRPMCDIDLIVRPEHGNDAVRAVEELGYVPNQVEVFGSFTREAVHARAFHRPGHMSLPIEIHNVLVRGDRGALLRDETWFWEHTISVPINGRSVLTLSEEVHMMQLCAHLVSHHGWTPSFIWMYDLHALLVKYQETFDWDKFTALARQLNWEAFCRHALKAASAFLHTPVPETVLGDLSRASRKSRVLEWQTRWPATRALRTLANCWGMPDLRTRLLFLWHTMFPAREYMVNRYRPQDHRMWPLLYPYRWGIMLREVTKLLEHSGASTLHEEAEITT